MTPDERRNDWNDHKLKVYEKFDNLDEKIETNTATNEKQYQVLNGVAVTLEEIKGDMKVFKFKIAGISTVVSGIVAFILKHLG